MSINQSQSQLKRIKPEEEIAESEDLVEFQSSLDESIKLAKDLVHSWIPKNLDKSWDSPSSNSNDSFNSTSFNAKTRPPRLGLGANVTKYHIQQAEDTKLRNKLLSNGSKKRSREEELPSSKSLKTRVEGDSGSESEEGSRSNSFKKLNCTTTTKKTTSFTSVLTNGKKSTKNKNNNNQINNSTNSHSSIPSTLFNPATPTKSSPSTSALPTPPSQQVRKTIAPISFYASVPPPSSIIPSTSTSSSISTIPGNCSLTKNQRKKERDKARLLDAKRIRMEESRAAEEQEEEEEGSNLNGGRVFETEGEEEVGVGEESRDSSVSPTPPSPRLKDHLKKRLVKPPFAPVDSSSGGEEVIARPSLKPVAIAVVAEKEEVSGEEMVKGEEGEKKQKKRRRNKKKKVEEGSSTALLNLEARPVISSP